MSDATARDACTGPVPKGSPSSRTSWKGSGTSGSKHSNAKRKGRRRRSMDATTESTVVERTISIAASPEKVWEFLVDPQKSTRWMGLNADLDPRPGGTY